MLIAANEQGLEAFKNLKFRKTPSRYVVYKIQQEKIVLQKVGDKDQNWDSFLNSLPENEYRFCVFDFQFTNADYMAVSKLIFINWNPDSTPLKGRLLYAAAKQNFKKQLNLNTKDFTLSSRADYNEAEMIKQLSK